MRFKIISEVIGFALFAVITGSTVIVVWPS